MKLKHLIYLANSNLTEKQIIDLHGWDVLISVKLIKEAFKNGYINEL